MSTTKWQVWVIPTAINKHSKASQIGGNHDSYEDAQEAKWFDEQDEPAPDKYDYYQWIIKEVQS